MDDPFLCGLVISSCVFGVFSAVLYLGCLELSKFTGGKLLKLEDVDEKLAERLDGWMPLPDAWRMAARLSLLLCIVGYASSVGAVTALLEAAKDKLSLGIGALLLLLFGYVVVELVVPCLMLRRTARLLCFFIPLFRFLSWLFFPVVILSHFAAVRAREKAEEQGEESVETTAEDEIMSLVAQNEEDGEESELAEDERRMIAGALELDNIDVHEIMTPRVDIDGIDQTATLEEAREIIVKSGHSRIPVFEETIDRIKGVIYAKDLLNDEKVEAARKGGLLRLCRQPLFVPESKNSGDLLAEFQSKKNHFAVVIDEYGGTAGIVTFEDILEEVVGEIYDEYDTPAPEETIPDGQDGWFYFEARTAVTAVNEKMETDIPEDNDFDTIGGYLSSCVGHIPQEKETVETDELVAEVLEAEPRRVVRVRIRRKMDDRNGTSHE